MSNDCYFMYYGNWQWKSISVPFFNYLSFFLHAQSSHILILLITIPRVYTIFLFSFSLQWAIVVFLSWLSSIWFFLLKCCNISQCTMFYWRPASIFLAKNIKLKRGTKVGGEMNMHKSWYRFEFFRWFWDNTEQEIRQKHEFHRRKTGKATGNREKG